MNETIIVGMEIIAKVGRNEVEAIVIEVADTGIKAASKKSGKEFQVKTILQVLTPLVEANRPHSQQPKSLYLKPHSHDSAHSLGIFTRQGAYAHENSRRQGIQKRFG